MIKRHNIFVVGVAVVIAASFWIVPVWKNKPGVFSYNIFKTADGWGYDILVNDTLQIHQASMPVVDEQKGFPTAEQAKGAAILVITKLKARENPAISRAELDRVLNE